MSGAVRRAVRRGTAGGGRRKRRHPGARPGVALLAALAALLLVGALATALALRVREDAHAARLTMLRLRARDAAEGRLWATLPTLDARVVRKEPVGRATVRSDRDGAVDATVTITRVGARPVWVVAAATVHWGSDLARDRVGVTLVLPDDPEDPRLVAPTGPAFVVVP